jgi:hypothetical protein
MSRSVQYVAYLALMVGLLAIGIVGMGLGLNPTGPLLLFGGTFAVGMFLVQRRLDRRRTAKLRRTALELGLRFQETGERLEAESLLALPLLAHGVPRGIRNVISTKGEERELVVFDYAYRDGQRGPLVGQTCAAVRLRQEGVPEFQLRPEHWVHRLGEIVGFGDIDFDTHPDFSTRYRLLGKDEDAIRGLFRRGLLDRLTGDPGWSIESNGEWVLFYREDSRIAPADLARFHSESRTLASLLSN